jgi:SAM-dependent methyltransferase
MRPPRLISNIARAAQRWLLARAGLRIERAVRRGRRPDERQRFVYQRRHVDFDIEPGAEVLDIGSGGDPFPYATVLVDRYPGPTHHRHAPFVHDRREFVQADVCDLPFADKSFDFVYCAHVLEHVDDPLAACREIIRVGKRGYLETPTLAKDMLFAWNIPGMHKWHVLSIADNLCFYELSPRQSAGVRSTVFRDMILGRWQHPMQDVFWRNSDLFNVMFLWEQCFNAYVFRLDGSVESFTPRPAACPKSSDLPAVSAPPAGTCRRSGSGSPDPAPASGA